MFTDSSLSVARPVFYHCNMCIATSTVFRAGGSHELVLCTVAKCAVQLATTIFQQTTALIQRYKSVVCQPAFVISGRCVRRTIDRISAACLLSQNILPWRATPGISLLTEAQ